MTGISAEVVSLLSIVSEDIVCWLWRSEDCTGVEQVMSYPVTTSLVRGVSHDSSRPSGTELNWRFAGGSSPVRGRVFGMERFRVSHWSSSQISTTTGLESVSLKALVSSSLQTTQSEIAFNLSFQKHA